MPPTLELAPVRRTPLSVAALAYYAGYTLWALAMLAGLVPRDLANDLLFFPLYLMAGFAAFRAARLPAASQRNARGWRLVGLAWINSAGNHVT